MIETMRIHSIVSLSYLVLDSEREIEEVDLNPVIVGSEGKSTVAVDGLVV